MSGRASRPHFYFPKPTFLHPIGQQPCRSASENPLDRRKESPGPTALVVLASPLPVYIPFLVTLVLGRGRLLVYVDVYDLVTREVAQDDLPRDPGYAHELVGASYEQGNTVAVKRVQFGPEFQHRIDGLLYKIKRKSQQIK